jgi:hypothetical protein
MHQPLKIIKVQKDETSGDYFLMLEDFKDIVDTSQVVYYELEPLSVIKGKNTEGLSVKFYDKDKNLLKLKD